MGAAPQDHAFATAFVSVIAQPAAIVDSGGAILSWNDDFLTCLSKKPIDALGMSLWDVVRADDAGQLTGFFDPANRAQTGFCAKITVPAGQFKLSLDRISIASRSQVFLCQLTTDMAMDSSRLRFLLEHLDQGVWNYNILTSSLAVTDAWRRMRGIPLDEEISQASPTNDDWLDDIHPDDRDLVLRSFNSQVSGAADDISIQYRRKHRAGHWVWLSARSSVMVADQNGAPIQIVGLDTDITEIKQNEADLEQVRKKLQLAIEAAGIGVWDYDAVTGVERWDERMYELYGLSSAVPAEPSDIWEAGLHPDDAETTRALSLQCLQDEKDFACDYRILSADGTIRRVRSNARFVKGDPARGTNDRMFGVNIDVTEDHRQAAELSELTSKFQLANEAAGIGIWEFNLASGQGHWDDRMYDLYGIAEGDRTYHARIWEDHLHPDDAQDTIKYAQYCLREQKDLARDYRILRDDGEVRHMRSLARLTDVAKGGGKMLGINIDVTEDYRRTEELERARTRLEHDSRHDALTGLANRRLLDETTEALLERLAPKDTYAVLHIDLDHFKQINDTLGHAAGDDVLVHVANTLRDITGERGLVCRIGGDEFVVLLYAVRDEKDCHRFCQSVLDEMAKPVTIYDHTNVYRLSIGCALGFGDVEDTSEVFINADVALYAAKSDGRSCYKVFAPGLRAVSMMDTHAHNDLYAAMAAGEIICQYQPQFDAQTYDIIGAEALVRWNCPNRGLVPPGDFMPLAQKTGLLARVDEYALDLVLDAQTRWHDAGLDVPRVSLNISFDRLKQPGLVVQIAEKLKAHHKLAFELLETAFLDVCADDVQMTLDAIRDAGILLDLDDFGSGHSSIVALQAVKPDRVKFDRLLVAPLGKNPAQVLILEALAKVAALEGCGVVVEGIETEAQVLAISQLECEALQGLALARPMSEEEFLIGLAEASQD